MKHFLLIIIAFSLTLAASAQYTPVTTNHVDNANYNVEYQRIRNKSTNAKIEAVILNVTGIVLCVTGTVMAVAGEFDKSTKTTSYDDNDNPIPINNTVDDNLINNGITVAGAGVILGIGSAVLYTRSGMLYHKAREIRMSMNTNSINIPTSGIQSFRVPQVGLGISVSL